MSSSRRRRWPWIVFVLLLVVPVVEVTIIIEVGRAIGGWQTLAVLVLWSLLGAWIVRREWSASFSGLTDALRTGRMPARELADAALALVGGILLLAPGFLTDAVGLFLILPFTRPITRPLLQAAVAKRILAGSVVGGMPPTGPSGGKPGGPGPARRPRRSTSDDIIEGEIVEDNDE